MAFRLDREKNGFCCVYFSDGNWRVVKSNEYEPLTTALRQGAAWYEAVDLYGNPCTIRLANVRDVGVATRESIAAYDLEQDEKKAYDRATGD